MNPLSQQYHAVVITGDLAYYQRFGFESASKYDIYYGGLDCTEEAPFFMVKFLDVRGKDTLNGTYYDPTCYFIDGKDVDEFDKVFPTKVKEVRLGQFQ